MSASDALAFQIVRPNTGPKPVSAEQKKPPERACRKKGARCSTTLLSDDF